MKKIININLSGRVIPIEDAAYESLQRYVESLRRYFANEEGRDEIINDIESRIAELMNDKVRKGAAAVTEADMAEIINSMGRVEDFEASDAAEAASATSNPYEPNFSYGTTGNKTRFKGRLYRDRRDKLLGGVCSGIANYMNVDPAVVRLLFAIITFGGFGFGFFLYILAWIILPASDLEGYSGKRLFRNPEDRMIGGVAGGLAAYFNKPSSTIRLIFGAPLLLNILIGVLDGIFSWGDWGNGPGFGDIFTGSITGTFILAYIILWIVLPEARSPYEKMEMRGERVDVNSIRQNVQDRAQTFSQEVRDSAMRFSSQATEFANTRGRAFATEVAASARPVASGLGHAIGVLFKAFFIFIAGSIAFGLFITLLTLIFGGGPALSPIKQGIMNFGLDGFWQNAFFWGTLIFFFAVPIIAFITWLVRRLMRVRSNRPYLGWTFGGLWTLGWICIALLASSIARDTRFYRKVEQPVTITQPQGGRMIVNVSEPEVAYSGDLWWEDSDARGWDITDDSLKLANVKLRVSASNDSNYQVTIWRYSAGRSRKEAEARAQKVQYAVSYTDSVLNLGSGLGIDKTSKFRGQKVLVEIKVPVGKKLRFDESITDKLEPMNVRVRVNDRRNRDNWDMDWDEDENFDWETGVDYVMGTDGELAKLLPDGTLDRNNTNSGVYEYKDGDAVKDSIRQSTEQEVRQRIEEKERQLEEERRRLEQLEKGTTRRKPAATNAPEPATIPVMPLFPFLI
ncbi:phage shock protein C (PspC) family protein [Cnuella takakiae]|uniref:Phage shock protein C (PspC) family protein n=1 Tax=Cnuella takakiae TaxID=1302690 RepID=A0A1M5F8M2_9BACT|nr:PspC domain-containing protein [Cnuella takakiae]OLY91010.1 hypothetical protein BUE76_03170 [Cnuella takakiae]SHF87738.1 phage shock protein C (PspC) family protein [Cnuella takakiae]